MKNFERMMNFFTGRGAFIFIITVILLVVAIMHVNIKWDFLLFFLSFRFNRYILECKWLPGTIAQRIDHRFNRYILECKYCIACRGQEPGHCFNRYILECKLIHKTVRHFFC